jgi:hypothetical protein
MAIPLLSLVGSTTKENDTENRHRLVVIQAVDGGAPQVIHGIEFPGGGER